MNKDSLQVYLLNGISIESFYASFVWGIIGFIASMILELIASSKIKKTGGFSFNFWIKDNFFRVIVSFIIILIGSTFGTQITGQLQNWSSLIIGFITDKLIEGLIKFKKKIDVESILNKFLKK